MKRLIIWLALLLPFIANAQVNGTIQKTASSGVVRGNFGSSGADTIVTVRGVSVNGQLLQYNSTYKKWIPYTPSAIGSTGIISGGTMTGVGSANLIVSSGTGTVLDNTTPSSPAFYNVSWVTDTIGLTDNSTNYIYVTSGGVIMATTVTPTPQDYRTRIYLGRAQKISGAITSINGDYVPVQQSPANIDDMFKAYGLAKTGLAVTPDSINLKIDVASGDIFGFGINFSNNVLSPNNISYSAVSKQTFRMVTSGDISTTNVTDLPVGFYNPTGTTVSAIGGGANESSIFTIYKFPTTGNVRILYGNTTYASLSAAVTAIGTYVPTPPAVFRDAIIIGYIASVKNATNLSNTSQAVFVTTNKFGLAGGALASSALTNYVQKSGDTMTGTLNGTDIVLSGDLTADSVKVTGGSSSQALMADGSLYAIKDSLIRNQNSVDQIANIRIDGNITVGEFNSATSNFDVYGNNVNNGSAFGSYNRVFSYDNMVGGTGNFADAKIGGGYGNTNIISGNDSWAAGNRTTTGRKMFQVSSQGVDDPGLGIGNRAYVIVAADEGDITGHFPNATKDGDTAYIDSTYAVGYTISGGFVSNPSVPGDTWRMPPYLIVRSATQETGVMLKKILKADYNSSTGTKIYYDTTANAYPSISFVYGSYAPIVQVDDIFLGNSQHTSGLFSQATGYASSATGGYTRAWNGYAFASGFDTKAYGLSSFTQGYGTNADAYSMFAGGRWNTGGGNRNSWVSTDPLFQLGNGTSNTSRANAFEVLKNGTTNLGGALNGTTATMSGKIAWGSGSYSAGISSLWNQSDYGTLLLPKTGSINDFTHLTAAGGILWQNPTGTTKSVFEGSISSKNTIYSNSGITEPSGYQLNSTTMGYSTTGAYGWITAGGAAARTALALNANGGNVGIGTTSPSVKLEVNGDIKAGAITLTTGANNGYVLKSDASGNATWQSAASGMTYKGAWNASTNTPTLADGVGTTGDMYAVSTGGTQFGRTFVAGGFAIYNGSIWEPVGTSASVTSVNSLTGSVQLNPTLSGNNVGITGGTSTIDISTATGVANKLPLAGGTLTGALNGTTISTTGSINSNSTIYSNSNIAESSGYQLNAITSGYSTTGSYGWITAGGAAARTLLSLNGNGGNVSIGTTTDSGYKLDVNGTGRFTGALIASNLSGTNTGDQTSVSGNAGTATALQTARNIQGVSFNGTADINPINGTGFVKATGTTLSYDNSTYLTTSTAASTYAPLNSPTFTGTPSLPTGTIAVTQTQGDNSNKLSTTAYADEIKNTVLAAQKQIANIYTNTSTTGTTTETLFTSNIAQSNLSADGDRIDFNFAGSFGLNANDKFVYLLVGGNTIAVSGNASSKSFWECEGYLMRTSSTTFRLFIRKAVDYIYSSAIADYTVTDFNPLTFSVLGQTNNASFPVTVQMGYLQSKKAP